jgi:hypothetical protein
MANNGSAELKPGSPIQTCHDDKSLFIQENCPAGTNQPLLRIVYSADRVRKPPLEKPSLVMNTASPGCPSPDGPSGMPDRTIQAQIGRMLRDIFADVAAEPVPRRFIELLAALDLKEKCR